MDNNNEYNNGPNQKDDVYGTVDNNPEPKAPGEAPDSAKAPENPYQNPSQGGYDNNYQQGYGQNYQQNPGQGYGQNYQQNPGQGYDNNYQQNPGQGYDSNYQQGYDNNYQQGYGQNYQQNPGQGNYDNNYQQNYDPNQQQYYQNNNMYHQPPNTPQGNGKATASMVLGIISIPLACGCYPLGIILGVIGIIFAFISRNDTKEFSSQAKAGLITSIVGLCLALIMFFVWQSSTSLFYDILDELYYYY